MPGERLTSSHPHSCPYTSWDGRKLRATTRHRPIFTVEEGRDLKEHMPGGHSKNLFLKDKKGALFLLSALGDTAIDLNAVSKLIGAGRFSFGNADLLMSRLGVSPGAVTAFGSTRATA